MIKLFISCALVLAGAVWAQDKSPAQVAAEALLSKDVIGVEYTLKLNTGTFNVPGEAQPGKGQMVFFGVRDACLNGYIKTAFSAKDGVVIFDLQPKMSDCSAIQYRFDPITKAGEVWSGPAAAGMEKSSRATIRIK